MYLRSKALDFIEQFFLVPFKADYKGDRIGDNAYFKMLREALTNLLMHQNFYIPSPSQVTPWHGGPICCAVRLCRVSFVSGEGACGPIYQSLCAGNRETVKHA
jgi:hypothetical protein